MTTSLTLNYQLDIVSQLVADDSLVILGKGLGLTKIVANLLHVLCASGVPAQSKSKTPLILLINATDFENFKVAEELMQINSDNSRRTRFTVVGGNTTVDKRRLFYQAGDVVSLSNRVLATDFLAEILDPAVVTGLVVLHAEAVRDFSNDRFVVNLYRNKNKWGFIKAVSEDAERISKDQLPLQHKCTYLKLGKVDLWPRFHVRVSKSLNKAKKGNNVVTEVRVAMSDYTTRIQNAILACIEGLIGELRRNNMEIASDYWTIENAFDDGFVRSIRGSLEAYWHRLSATTRQVVFDLGTLQGLLGDLMVLDSVEFNSHVQTLLKENAPDPTRKNKNSATWLLIPEASTLINCAKERVYQKIGGGSLLIEEPPKWQQLAGILEDINAEKMGRDSDEDGPTLIMCKREHSCRAVREYLCRMRQYDVVGGQRVYSGRKIMVRRLKGYIAFKNGIGQESRRIFSELDRVERKNEEDQDEFALSKTFLRGNGHSSKRRRTRGGAIVAEHDRLFSKNLGEEPEEVLEVGEEKEENDEDDEDDDFEFDSDDDYFGDESKAFSYEYLDRNDEVIVQRFNAASDDLLLEELSPSYIICYQPDLAFIRQVELYRAARSEKSRPKCFFMYYGDSVEEQRYLNEIKREKDAFTSLIRDKASMPKMFRSDEDDRLKYAETRDMGNTRIAGGSGNVTKKVRVVVDSREFRSHLPFMCYMCGLEVVPCLLTVGDYILSPKLCVERKSIPDLIASLKSGHLYQQCEQMFRHYETPILLIEFESKEGGSSAAFSLQPFTTFQRGVMAATASNSVTASLQLQLMVLLTAFPTLKILWSSSPLESARIFLDLKRSQDEPDVAAAIQTGLNPLFGQEAIFNDQSITMIQNIPGIDSVNYPLVIARVRNADELSRMTKADLAAIIGKEAAAKVRGFFARSV